MSAEANAPASTSAGFTLIELLVALGIGVALISAVGTALVLSLRTAGVAQDQIEEAARTHVTTRWFLADVNSAFAHRPPGDGDDEGPRCASEASAGFDDDAFVGGFDDAFGVHADWWVDTSDTSGDPRRRLGGELRRTTCGGIDDPTETAAMSQIEGPDDVTITCPAEDQPAMTCTLTWTITPETAEDAGRSYELTATRRGWWSP